MRIVQGEKPTGERTRRSMAGLRSGPSDRLVERRGQRRPVLDAASLLNFATISTGEGFAFGRIFSGLLAGIYGNTRKVRPFC